MIRSIAAALILSCGSITHAAEETPQVSVRGKSARTFEPDTVQVRCRVFAHGMTAASALKKLNASRKLLEKRLSEVEGPSPAHSFGACVEQPEVENNLQQQFQVMIMPGNKPADDDKDDGLIRMAFTVTLEWPLAGEKLEERYRTMDRINQQLEELSLSKGDSSKKRDEVKSRNEGRDDKNEGKLRVTDGPTFYYVKRLNEAEADTCAKDAFADARRRAARLAKASGSELGRLVRLSDHSTQDFMSHVQDSRVMMEHMFGEATPSFPEDQHRPANELVSRKLEPIRHESEISVVFALSSSG